MRTARALAVHPAVQACRVTVIVYDPRSTPSMGLVRPAPLLVRVGWSALGTSLRRLVPTSTAARSAGETLADLALSKIQPPAGRLYAALRPGQLTWPDPSELARHNEVMEALWRDSAALVGLPEVQRA